MIDFAPNNETFISVVHRIIDSGVTHLAPNKESFKSVVHITAHRDSCSDRYVFLLIVIGCSYIALFSALEQTHCAHVACDFE